MSIGESEFAVSSDPRLAAQLVDHATSALPAWLWSADGSRILWANAVGAAIFGAANTKELTGLRLTQNSPRSPRLCASEKRCRRPGKHDLKDCAASAPALGAALTCICSRFLVGRRLGCGAGHRQRASGTTASTQRAGQALVRRSDPGRKRLSRRTARCSPRLRRRKNAWVIPQRCPLSGSLRPDLRRWRPAALTQRQIKATLACGGSVAVRRVSCWLRSAPSRVHAPPKVLLEP